MEGKDEKGGPPSVPLFQIGYYVTTVFDPSRLLVASVQTRSSILKI